MDDWNDILDKFYEEFGRKVRDGSVSALSSTEAIMVGLFIKWLEKHYAVPTILS
jgi:hypothetical protein